MHIRFRVLFYISDRAISITNNCPLSLILSLAERVWPLSRSLWPIDAVFSLSRYRASRDCSQQNWIQYVVIRTKYSTVISNDTNYSIYSRNGTVYSSSHTTYTQVGLKFFFIKIPYRLCFRFLGKRTNFQALALGSEWQP